MSGIQTEFPFGGSHQPTVLQVLPALVTGGVERGTVDIAAAIVENGGRAIVASAGGPMLRELTRLGGKHIEMPLDTKNPFIMAGNIRKLEDLVNAENIEVIHARSRAPAWSAWFAAHRTNRCFVTTFHGTYGRENPIKRYYNSIMTRGERVIAISEFIAGHVRQHYGVPLAQISVIPRGVDLEKFSASNISKERIIKLAQDWRLPDGVPVIMLPGRLTRWKGQILFIEAIKQIKHVKFRCLIIGSDQGRSHYRQSLENEISKCGMSEYVHVIDSCEDMPAAYMLADVVVSASIEPEAFGRVVAEAQALGRLVIAADHGGARETVIDGETGWLTPPGDRKALARSIDEALSRPLEERQLFSQRARRHIRDNYSREEMCKRTLELYKAVVASNA